MSVIINNNGWNPIPWGWGQGGCCGGCGNNSLTNMFGYMMMFNMMGNMFKGFATNPQQQQVQQYPYNPYPGLYLSGAGGAGGAAQTTQSYSDYLKQNEEVQMYNELKSSWPEFKFSKIGDKYYAYLKDDKTVHVEGESLDDLLGEINKYVAANPDKFKKKETSTTTESETASESAATGSETATETTGAADDTGATVDEASGSGSSGSASTNGPQNTYPTGWRKCKTVGYKYSSIDALMDSNTGVISDSSSVGYSGQRMSKENRDAYRAHVIKNNPSVFNKDGTIKSNADWTKLEVPDGATLRDNYGALPYYDKSKWIKATNETLRQHKENKPNPTSAKDIINYFAKDKNYTGYNKLTDDGKEKLVTDLIKLNPHCFSEDGKIKDTFSWDTFVYPSSAEVNATYVKTQQTKPTEVPKASRVGDSIEITYGGKVAATLKESSGWTSKNAHLNIKSGSNAGTWRLRCTDGDWLNYDKFTVANGGIRSKNYKVDCIQRKSDGAQYEVRTNQYGAMYVKLKDGTEITLEQFCSQ